MNMLAVAPKFGQLNREFNRLFEDFSKTGNGSLIPRVNISEDKNTIFIHAELPGISQEDVKVSVKDGVLTIRGQKHKEKETEGRSFYRIERRYGEFARSFTLPEHINEDAINASIKNGVLELTLPKIEPSKPQEREIPVGASLN